MAQITELTIGYARTINLGHYESAQIKAAVTVAIEPGEVIADVRATMQSTLRLLLEDTWKAQHRPTKNPPEENGNG
jgi:hypothetical protein